MSDMGRSGGRRAVLIVASCLVAAVVVGAGIFTLGRSGGADASAGTATSSATSPTATAEPTTVSTGSAPTAKAEAPKSSTSSKQGKSPGSKKPASGRKTFVPSELDAVAPTAAASAPAGVSVKLAKVEAVTGKAVAAGEVSGPAVRLTVAVTNGTTDPLDLDHVVVNAYSGKDRRPAPTIMQPGGVPFGGSLAPGKTATGVVLFTMSTGQRQNATVTVDYAADQPAIVFRGSLR